MLLFSRFLNVLTGIGCTAEQTCRLLALGLALLFLSLPLGAAFSVVRAESPRDKQPQLEITKSATVEQKPLVGKITYRPSYRISAGDSLSLEVYFAEEFKQDNIQVRADGTASFKGIGQLNVADKTVEEVEVLVRTALMDIIRDPLVTLSVNSSRSGIVYLLGAFKKPGMYEISTQTSVSASGDPITRSNFTLTNVIANAGGVAANADISNIVVERYHTGEKISVNYWDVIDRGDLSQDVLIQSGDRIQIPELPELSQDDESFEKLLKSPIGPKTIPVRIVGELTAPGTYELDSESPYLMTAIAKAGGFEDTAQLKSIQVRRLTRNKEFKTITLNPENYDWVLRPNDVIYVEKTKLAKSAVKGTQIGNVVSPVTTGASSLFTSLILFRRN